MKRMTKLLLAPLLALFASLSSVVSFAHCPLCTGAIGVMAVGASYYGIDSSIIGLFIGAFAISTGLWVAMKVKKQYIMYQKPLIVISSFFLTVVPLMSIGEGSLTVSMLLFGEEGSLFNNVYTISTLFIGSLVGSFLSVAGYWVHNYVKKLNNGVIFPYQGIVFTVLLLVATSGLFYLII